MTECTKERFLNDVKDHKMTILHDDGVFRNIKFARQNTINMSFTLTTWTNHLCISGDMGCYVFSRLEDMFHFFSTPNNELSINEGYWCEKLQSISKFGSNNGSIREFSAERTVKSIKLDLQDSEASKEQLEEFNDLLETAEELDNEEEFRQLFEDNQDIVRPIFDDLELWEHYCYNPTFHIQWCLYAIKWGIMQYFNEKLLDIRPQGI
jgi:hypothetical protein